MTVMADTEVATALGELIERLEATGKWWMIGKGKGTPNEPLYGCLVQEPKIDGQELARTEGHSLPTCIERAENDLGDRGVETG